MPAQNVVERNEIDPPGVEYRQAEQVGPCGVLPAGITVLGAQGMELIVAGSNEQAIPDRQDADRGLGKLVRPDFIAGLQRDRDEPAIFEWQIEAFSRGRRPCAFTERRSEIFLPENESITRAYREERARLRLGEQPPPVPLQRDNVPWHRAAPSRAAVAISSCLDHILAACVDEAGTSSRWSGHWAFDRPCDAAICDHQRDELFRLQRKIDTGGVKRRREGGRRRKCGAPSCLERKSDGRRRRASARHNDKKCHSPTRYGGATQRHPAIIACYQRSSGSQCLPFTVHRYPFTA